MTHAGYFEGIGGFSLAAEWAGLETIYHCEYDYYRRDWLKHRWPSAAQEDDIRVAKGMYANIWTAGFPCQDISVANPNAVGITGNRSGLWFKLLALIEKHRPPFVILENSPLIRKKGLNIVLDGLAQIGYDAEWDVVHKTEFGFSDWRKRFFCVAYPAQIGRLHSHAVFSIEHKEIVKQKVERQKQLWAEIHGMDGLESTRKAHAYALSFDAGIPPKLAQKEIEAYGDAVCPYAALYVLELLKLFIENE